MDLNFNIKIIGISCSAYLFDVHKWIIGVTKMLGFSQCSPKIILLLIDLLHLDLSAYDFKILLSFYASPNYIVVCSSLRWDWIQELVIFAFILSFNQSSARWFMEREPTLSAILYGYFLAKYLTFHQVLFFNTYVLWSEGFFSFYRAESLVESCHAGSTL